MKTMNEPAKANKPEQRIQRQIMVGSTSKARMKSKLSALDTIGSTMLRAASLVALLITPVNGSAKWVDGHEATFVAQFTMTITPTCSPPDSKIKATCASGTIELVDTSHSSIRCYSGSSVSEMQCFIRCGEDCEDVFVNDSTAEVYFKCATAKSVSP